MPFLETPLPLLLFPLPVGMVMCCCCAGCGCGLGFGFGSDSGLVSVSGWDCGCSCRICGFCFKGATGEAEALEAVEGRGWSRRSPFAFPVLLGAGVAFIASEGNDFWGGCSSLLAVSFSN